MTHQLRKCGRALNRRVHVASVNCIFKRSWLVKGKGVRVNVPGEC